MAGDNISTMVDGHYIFDLPLYSNLAFSLTVERAKYLETERVDANSVAQSIVKSVENYDSANR